MSTPLLSMLECFDSLNLVLNGAKVCSRTWLFGVAGCTVILLSLLYYYPDVAGILISRMKNPGTDQKSNAAKMSTTSTMSSNVSSTTVAGTQPFTLSPEEEKTEFWIGLSLAVGSSLFIGTSFILKKLGLLSVGKKEGGVRAGAGGHRYLLEWKWWSGMFLMMAGEVMNFVAYTFAPASLVTPLGALSVIFSAILASTFLKEGLNLLGKLGCALCVIGSTMMVLHAPKDQEVENMDQLLDKVKEPGILVLVGVFILAAAITIIFIEPRYGQSNVVVYVFICSSLGALTVQGAKGLGVAVKETFAGRNEFTNWLTYVMLALVVVNVLFQLNYLNKALDTFNTAVVTPTYYVMFSSFVILISLVLFKEFLKMSVEDVIGDLCGFLTIVGGIFLLNAFKDMDITYKNLPKAKKASTVAEKDTDQSDVKPNSLDATHNDENVFEFGESVSISGSESKPGKDGTTPDHMMEAGDLKDVEPSYDNKAVDVDDIAYSTTNDVSEQNGEVTRF